MIRHICGFKLKDENKEANIAEFLKRAEGLKAIPEIRSFAAVKNAEGCPDANYEVCLIMDFDSVEELMAYQVNPIHKEFGAFVATIRLSRACIDFEI